MTLPRPLYYAQYHHLENIHTFHCWKMFFPCTYWHVCNTPFFYFASSIQSVPWENICRNFGKGNLSFALCFLQVHGELNLPNNGLQLLTLNGLTSLHFGCEWLCTRKTSAVLSQPQLFETAWKLPIEQMDENGHIGFPLHLLGIYKTTQSVQSVKVSTMVVHCYFLLAHLMILSLMLSGRK